MLPAEIDLFVDRLCAFWPTTNIARNTLKNGWKHSEVIIAATADHGKQVLETCKGFDRFPDLRTIEAQFRSVAGLRNSAGNCQLCGNNGWVEADDIHFKDMAYRAAKRCTCNGGNA
jgi:hypothetical protein